MKIHRICFIANADSIHSYRWIKYFASKGHEIIWISLTNLQFPKINNVKLFKLKGGDSFFELICSIFEVRRIITESKPDILHIHYLGKNALLGLFSGHRRIVSTPWGSDIIFNSRNFFKRFIVAQILKRTKVITCDANHIRKYLLDIGISSNRIKIVNFGIDTKIFSPRVQSVINHRDFNSKIIRIISTRNLEPVYDIETLIRAIPHVIDFSRQVRFTIVGQGSSRNDLMALAKQLAVSEYINFMGHISPANLPEILSDHNIYISTSLSDAGIASSTAEAMACGLPAIVSDTGENSLWIEDGVNGLIFSAGNSLMLANRIILLLENIKLRGLIAANGRVTICNRNDFENEMLRMATIYGQLGDRYE